jgi:tetratricopeptide (TPR) repeat protein
MNGDFIWDDKYFISENPTILNKGFLKSFLISPFGGSIGADENSLRLERLMQFYRPLTSFSYWLDCKIWGFNPAGFHLTNILLQIANTLILCFILLNLGLDRTVSFFSCLLFSVFPFHFENVAWISGRTDLLSFLFAALSVSFFMTFLKRKNYLFLTLSSLFYLCSLFSKENNVFLIIIYFFILYWKEPKFKNCIIGTIPFAIGFFVWIVLRSIALGYLSPGPSGRTLQDFFSTIGFYFVRLFFPFNLSFTVDSYRIFKNIPYLILGIIVTLLFVYSALLLLKKRKRIPVLASIHFSFYLLLLPSVVLIFSATTFSFIAWRFLYLVSALFVSCVAYQILRAMKHKFISIILLLLLSCLYVYEIYPKNKSFGKSNADFWLSVTNMEREDILAKYNIGVTWLPKDEKKALAIFDDIISHREHHSHLLYEIRIYEELAQYYTFKKNFPAAEKYFKKLLELQNFQSQHFHFTYAFFLAFQGKIPEGEKIVLGMLNTFPLNHLVLVNAARFYIVIENYERAKELLTKDYDHFPTREGLVLLKRLEEEEKRKEN